MPYPHMPANPTGGADLSSVTLINGGADAVAGSPVYSSSPGSFSLAVASGAATAMCIGILGVDTKSGASGSVQVTAVLPLTAAQWDARAGTSGGLTFGQPYYLDPATPGKLTGTAPSAAGQFVALLGVALSTTQLRLLVQPPIGL